MQFHRVGFMLICRLWSRHRVSVCKCMSALRWNYGVGSVRGGSVGLWSALNEMKNNKKRGVKSGGGGPYSQAWIGVYSQGGGRVRQGRSRGGRLRKKEETRQKFAIISMEEGTGGCGEGERFFSGWRRSGRQPGRTSVSLNRDIWQQRGPLLPVCVCVCVCVVVIRQARGSQDLSCTWGVTSAQRSVL